MKTAQLFWIVPLLYLTLLIACRPSTPPPPESGDILWCENFTDSLSYGWSNALDNNVNWDWNRHGIADGGEFWGSRDSLESDTPFGALVIDSDAARDSIASPHQGAIVSPIINIPPVDRVHLSFYQSFRNFNAQTIVEVSVDSGSTWVPFQVNERVGPNTETFNTFTGSPISARPETRKSNKLVIDISSVSSNQTALQLRFTLKGQAYFWIIDDVCIKYPRETFPPELGDTLNALGIPYKVDSLGGAYSVDQLAVEWNPDSDSTAREEVRQQFKIMRYDTCRCNGDLELWTMSSEIVVDCSNTLIENGDFTDGATGFTTSSSLFEFEDCSRRSYFVGQSMAEKCSNPVWEREDFFEADRPGVGKFLIIQDVGSGAEEVWCQTVNIDEANQPHLLLFSGRNLSPNPNLFATLQIKINDTFLPDTIIISRNDEWEKHIVEWTPQTNGSFDICIEEVSGSVGSNYGIDDICLITMDSTLGPIIGPIEEDKKTAKASSGTVQEIDYNYTLFDSGNIGPAASSANPIEISQDLIVSDTAAGIRIAVLDTGVDIPYKKSIPNLGEIELVNYLTKHSVGCIGDDILGWNVVEKDDMAMKYLPYDWHGHGSHIVGLLIQQFYKAEEKSQNCCNFNILPVRTHDANGLGKLFDVSCGIYYATKKEADLINASWGFTAVQDKGILYNAINYANQDSIVIFSSAGNEGTDLQIYPNYPSSYGLPNVITIGALSQNGQEPWPNSNYADSLVHYMALGEEVGSIMPIHLSQYEGWGIKSGTSMANPVATANAALLLCAKDISGPAELKAYLSEYAQLLQHEEKLFYKINTENILPELVGVSPEKGCFDDLVVQ